MRISLPSYASKFFEKFELSKTSVIANIVVATLLLVLSISRIIYPFDLGNYESPIWTSALLAADGNNPYAYTTESPFTVSPYGYVFYLIIGLGIKLFGFQFWFGRFFSVLAVSICIICIIKTISLVTNNKTTIWLTVLIFLTSFGVQSWVANQRSDFPALAFGFVGLLLVFYESNSEIKSFSRSFLAILLLTSAVFCKLTTILPIFIAIIRYIQVGKIKHAILTFSSIAILGILAALSLNITSNGGYYFQHFYITRNISYSYLRSFLVAESVFLTTTGVIIYSSLLLSILYLIKSNWSLKRDDKEPITQLKIFSPDFPKSFEFLFILYFIFSFALNFYTSARNGSSINYFLEFILVSAILFGLVLNSIQTFVNNRFFYVGFIFILVFLSSINIFRGFRGEYFRWMGLPYYQEIVETLDKQVPQDAICIAEYSEFAAFAKRKYEFSDWMQYEDGRSPELKKLYYNALKSKKYSAFILQNNNAQDILPNCNLVSMKNPVPTKSFAVYLYVCK